MKKRHYRRSLRFTLPVIGVYSPEHFDTPDIPPMPLICITGTLLSNAGFTANQKVQVDVAENFIAITKIP